MDDFGDVLYQSELVQDYRKNCGAILAAERLQEVCGSRAKHVLRKAAMSCGKNE